MYTVVNILRNSLRPGWGPIIARKIAVRLKEKPKLEGDAAVKAWCASRQVDLETWAKKINREQWIEAEEFFTQRREASKIKLSDVGYDLGGGGAYNLLYFLVRILQPQTVVETGVAAGFSSAAILSALDKNGQGHLYSSDFPYFRMAEPIKFVGILVDEELKARWTLYCAGDRANLPRIAEQVERVDLVHYDSDKSIDGRSFGLQTLKEKMSPDSVVIFDDIQDNTHFMQLVTESRRPFLVFAFEDKWLGMFGGPSEFYDELSSS